MLNRFLFFSLLAIGFAPLVAMAQGLDQYISRRLITAVAAEKDGATLPIIYDSKWPALVSALEDILGVGGIEDEVRQTVEYGGRRIRIVLIPYSEARELKLRLGPETIVLNRHSVAADQSEGFPPPTQLLRNPRCRGIWNAIPDPVDN